jgi:hypothetical protein
MEKLLTELRLKADNCDNTKEGIARKGAYVDCIVMIKQIKNCTIPDVSNRREQLIAYQLWCYQHPEYDQVCQSSKVDIYLKAINCC